MTESPRKEPTQYQVRKGPDDWWNVTYLGRQGTRWDPLSREDQPTLPTPPHEHADQMPEDNRRAGRWSEFFQDLLVQFLKDVADEAKPQIRLWWDETGRPRAIAWMKAAAKSIWKRVTQRKSRVPRDHAPEDAKVTDVDPSTAIDLAHGVAAGATADAVNITAEQAQKELEDIAVLTKLVAAELQKLSANVSRELGESDESFLTRREEAEQLAVQNVTSNVQLMLIQGLDLGEAVKLLATNTPRFAADRVEAGSLSIESSSYRPGTAP
ncbi:hypothetical protein ARZXY2_4925 (plasmid) [Arthrobacter sp. ZXY-2]|nr:hypothetical protein ARZXY2_4925 [Arthrobacter sp. ZXY-2]